MKSIAFRFVSSIVVICLLIGIVGCYDKNACNEVINVATVFSQALIERDSSKLLEVSSSKYNWNNTNGYFKGWDYDEIFTEEKAQVLTCIQNSLSFEIAAGTVDASTKDEYAEVDVIFSRIDYEHTFSDPSNTSSAGLLMREMKNEEQTRRFRVTLTLVLEDGVWRISNLGDVYNTVYSFLNINISVVRSVRHVVSGCRWYYVSEYLGDKIPYYENVDTINMDLELDLSVFSADYSNVYYTVCIDDEIVYTSELGVLEGVYGEAQEAEVTEDGYLIPGEYTISFYDEFDRLLAEEFAIVECA